MWIIYNLLALLYIASVTYGTGSPPEMKSDKFIIPLKNKVNYISLEIEIGTPAQTVELLLDTGSSITWIISKDNPYCKEVKDIFPLSEKETAIPVKRSNLIPKGTINCQISGTFNPKNSSSYKETHAKSLNLRYLDTVTVSGNWVTEKFKIPTIISNTDFEIQSNDFELGIGKETNSTIGILGLGIPEFTYNREKNWIKYEKQNIVTKMKSQKLTQRSIFSIFLNDRSNDGELLIGYIDEAKFQGPLYTIKFINSDFIGDPILRYEVPLTELSVGVLDTTTNDSERENFELFGETQSYKKSFIPTILDTGSKFTYLPEELYDTLVAHLSFYYKVYGAINKHLIVPCTEIDQFDDVILGFKINDISLNIPMRSFLERSTNNITELHNYDKAKNLCLLGILPTDTDFAILGQAFFRSLYTVFDLDMMEVSLAPAKYSTKRALKEITLGQSVEGIKVESIVDGSSDSIVLDPIKDFIEDTRDGFYKYYNSAVNVDTTFDNSNLIISFVILFVVLY